MTTFDIGKAKAELPFLRAFIDFVNQQVGVYCDCLASLDGNKVRIERQIPRVQHLSGRRIESGRPVIVGVSVEDLASPDVIHHRIIRADKFISAIRKPASTSNNYVGRLSFLSLLTGMKKFALQLQKCEASGQMR